MINLLRKKEKSPEEDKLLTVIRNSYLEILLREPDKDGIVSYFNLIKSGKIKLNQLNQILKKSSEYNALQKQKSLFPIKTKDGFLMHLDPHDGVISRALSQNEIWEPEETKLLKNKITNKITLINIGSNIGYFVLLSSKLNPDGKIFAFEPNPLSYDIMVKNLKINGFKNVTTIQKATSNFQGKAKLYLSKTNHGDNRLSDKIIFEHDVERNAIEVNVVRLDDVCKNLEVDFMIIDTQGSELKVLEGALDMIKNSPRMKIIVEFWPAGLLSQNSEPTQFLNLLKQLGFKIFDIKTEKIFDPQRSFNDYPTDFSTNLYCFKNQDDAL